MNADVNLSPIDLDAAWTARTLHDDPRWIIELSDADNTELKEALAYAKSRKRRVPELSREDFPLPTLAARLEQIRKELTHGRAVVLIRGLPVTELGKEDSGTIFWGIGTYLGTASAQNAYGDVLGHVWDLGKNPVTDTSARGYQSRLKLNFHTDATDVVGLLCLRAAKAGGLSSIASSVAIHNEIVKTRPDLAKVLYEPFHYDLRGEEPEGHKPYVKLPVFTRHEGRFFCRFIRRYIESSQRFEDVPPLTDAQQEALALVEDLAHDERFRFDMALAPGDMQFLLNYSVLHSRTAYEDHPEIDRKRHLLRLWLYVPGFGELPESYGVRNKVIEAWLENPRAPIYDPNVLMGIETH